MILAPELTYSAIIEALENGRFYASTGPTIHSLEIHDSRAKLEFSDAVRVIMHASPKYCKNVWKPDGSEFNCAEFEIPDFVPYVYFTVLDKYGKKAYTHAIRREEFSQ